MGLLWAILSDCVPLQVILRAGWLLPRELHCTGQDTLFALIVRTRFGGTEKQHPSISAAPDIDR